MEQVVQHLPKELHASNRWVANILNMRRCTIQRILRGFSWDPYKVQVVQQLHEEDWENQLKPPNWGIPVHNWLSETVTSATWSCATSSHERPVNSYYSKYELNFDCCWETRVF